jgi:hypothetical protein
MYCLFDQLIMRMLPFCNNGIGLNYYNLYDFWSFFLNLNKDPEKVKMEESKKLSIKQWAEDDRPREKLLNGGCSSLSDAELIALLIGSGNRNETAVELARRILGSFENSLYRLGKQTVRELMQFRGIGHAKAVSIRPHLSLAGDGGMRASLKNRLFKAAVMLLPLCSQ